MSAFRQLLRQPIHTAINIVGLAVGLACFILIAVFAVHELSFERQFSKADRIYRVSRDYYSASGAISARPAAIAGPAAEHLALAFPEIENTARIICCGGVLQREDGELFFEPGYAEADNSLFQLFDFRWLAGDPRTALAEPFNVVLTRSAARKYFGTAPALGQTLLAGGGTAERWSLKVTGVIEDLPDSTHLKFDMLGSLLINTRSGLGVQERLTSWDNDLFHTYVLLNKGVDASRLEQRSAEFFERYVGTGVSKRTGFSVMPITDIHLRSMRSDEMK